MYFKSTTSHGRQSSEKFALFASLNYNLLNNTLGHLLKWESNAYLKQPLLNLHPSIVSQALRANKIIVDFMDHVVTQEERDGNGVVSNFDIIQVSSLVKLGCGQLEGIAVEIRDEIYCQLVRQTTGNSNRHSCCRGYQLILSCLAGFSPSRGLASFLLSHLNVGCRGGALLSRRTVKLAEDCLRALEMIQVFGSRDWGLSRNEIATIISENGSLSTKVWLNSDRSIDITVDSWTTIEELKLAVCAKMGIHESSILTLSLAVSNINEPDRRDLEVSLASKRGVVNTSYGLLRHHYSTQASKSKLKLRRRSLIPFMDNVSNLDTFHALAVAALDNYLRIDARNASTPFRTSVFNASDACLFTGTVQTQIESERITIRRCLSSMFRRRKSHITYSHLIESGAVASEIKVTIRLVVWLFPYGGPTESSISARRQEDSYECRLGYHGAVRSFRSAYRDNEEYGLPPVLSDECKLSDRAVNMRNGIYWPSDESTRNILYGQLVDHISSGKLRCTDDISTLKMAALMFAEQYQGETRPLPRGLPSIALMQETVMSALDKSLPSTLTDMTALMRADVSESIKNQLHAIIEEVTDLEVTFEDGFGFDLFPNIMGLNCLERTARSRNRGKFRILTHYPIDDPTLSIEAVAEREKTVDINWSDDIVWREFLCCTIVRLWLLHIDSLTARDCRDEYLLAAKQCVGYGTEKYHPSAVRISVLVLQHMTDVSQKRSPTRGKWNAHTGYDDSSIDDDNRSNSKMPIYVAMVSEYTCHTHTEQTGSPIESVVVSTSLELLITCEEVTITECTTVNRSENFNASSVIDCTLNGSTHVINCQKILIKIAMDDIISWGFDETTLVIKFKQRGGGHEASYYSDDEDEEECMELAQEKIYEGINTSGRHYHSSMLGSISESANDESPKSECSVCPIPQMYRERLYDNNHVNPQEMPGEHCDVREGLPRERRSTAESQYLAGRDLLVWSQRCIADRLSSIDEEGLKVDEESSQDTSHAVKRATGSDIDEDTSSQDEIKEMDVTDSSFRTDASSTATVANKRECEATKISLKKTASSLSRAEKENEEISIDLKYSAEVADLLRLYCIFRIDLSDDED